MKKQAVFIYDLESDKIVQVCDVRDVPTDKFEELCRKAEERAKQVLDEKKKIRYALIAQFEESIKELKTENAKLKKVLTYILGEDYDSVLENIESEETVHD